MLYSKDTFSSKDAELVFGVLRLVPPRIIRKASRFFL